MTFAWLGVVKNWLSGLSMWVWLGAAAMLGVTIVRRDAKHDERQEQKIEALEQDREIKENSDAYEDHANRVRERTRERVRDDDPVPDHHFRD